MNGFESPIYFDVLARSVLIGGLLLLAGFVWVLLDRREYEDPLRRRERQERERRDHGRETGSQIEDFGGDAPKSPHPRRGRRRAA